MSRYSKIVSANYHDRGGRNTQMPWLIRKFGTDPKTATAAKAIVATGVAFCPSSDYEYGFGCSTVGFCESANVVAEDSKEGVRVSFSGHSFYDPKRVPLLAVDKLILNSDGSMYAIPGEFAKIAASNLARRKAVA